ncbi:MAG: lipocalin family protein [Myxococcales bacterium]|nr:lipocalin family protein [Myxococcales bacterium]
MRGIRLCIMLNFICFFGACTEGDLQTVNSVDLVRYSGTWYEIARFPNKFQKKCLKSKALYSLSEKSLLTVENSCTTGNGSPKKVLGVARVKDHNSKAKLEVNFAPSWLRWFGLGWGKYWIIELDNEAYEYAVVSEPTRTYLWLLSRKPSMHKKIYEDILARLKNKGFDVKQLILSGSLD